MKNINYNIFSCNYCKRNMRVYVFFLLFNLVNVDVIVCIYVWIRNNDECLSCMYFI